MKRRIMIFDDDDDIQTICSLILRPNGNEVIGRSTCRDLLSAIDLYHPDVILLDNKIPDTGGVQACQLIKKTERFQGIPVILFSAHPNLSALAQEAGADYYLPKPFEITDLELMVEKALHAKTLDR